MFKDTKKIIIFLLLCLVITSFIRAEDKKTQEAVKLLPESYQEKVARALNEAGENKDHLIEAINKVGNEQREAIAFLIANMPKKDLKTLSQDFLVENINYAYEARKKLPWGNDVPDEIFLNYILPYANLTERRDNWRKDFYEKFLPVIKDCKTPGEAVVTLNKEVFKILNVKYHPTKRSKPDQSPYETISEGFASCSGLSILLIDVCRAVCIPARIAGTPMWADKSGNHNWVEIWDKQWYFTGAAEPAPLNETWFVKKAQLTKEVYAVSFAERDTKFPIVWAPLNKQVSADNVTKYYTTRRKLEVTVLKGEAPIANVLVSLFQDGQIITRDKTDRQGKIIKLELAGGVTYKLIAEDVSRGEKIEQEIKVPEEDKPNQITVKMQSKQDEKK